MPHVQQTGSIVATEKILDTVWSIHAALDWCRRQPVNWLNYKTGIKHLYFRMDGDNKRATIAIELRQSEPMLQQYYFEKLGELKELFQQTIGDNWQWELHTIDEDAKLVSRIGTTLKGVNIFDTADWPAIISFLKPRMQALDNFWNLVKETFE